MKENFHLVYVTIIDKIGAVDVIYSLISSCLSISVYLNKNEVECIFIDNFIFSVSFLFLINFIVK